MTTSKTFNLSSFSLGTPNYPYGRPLNMVLHVMEALFNLFIFSSFFG